MVMVNLCKYRDINGLPGKGIHKYRLWGLSIYDVVVTLIPACLAAYFFSGSSTSTGEIIRNAILIFTALIIMGIIVHRLFCVNTALNVMIFGVL